MNPESKLQALLDLAVEEIIEANEQDFLHEFHATRAGSTQMVKRTREACKSSLRASGIRRLIQAREELNADSRQNTQSEISALSLDRKLGIFATLVNQHPELMTAHRNLSAASEDDLNQLLLDAEEMGYELDGFVRKDQD